MSIGVTLAAFSMWTDAENSNDDGPPEDILRKAKSATVAIGRLSPASGPAQPDGFEILSSGFLYGYAPPESDSPPLIWVVTARHAVEGPHPPSALRIRVNLKSGGTAIDQAVTGRWHLHPSEDVAVALLRRRAGQLPPRPRRGPTALRETAWDVEALNLGDVATRASLLDLGLHEYTPVAMVGFPVGMIEGGRRDYPVVRSGRIAQIQGYLDSDPEHRTFLVDGSVFGGNSGGPVLVPKMVLTHGLNFLTNSALIGVVSTRKAIRVSDDADQGGAGFVENADLTSVVAMDAVHDLIEMVTRASSSTARDEGG